MRAFFRLLLAFPPVVAFAADAWIGTVKTSEGGISVQRGAESLAAPEGFRLQLGDLLRSGPDGRLSAILHDGTRFSLGPGTELTIDRFLYNPSQSQFEMVIKLLRGIAVFASGKIAEFAPPSVRIETPAGMVGLRGTRFAVFIE